MKESTDKIGIRQYLFLFAVFLLYSACSVVSKFASAYSILSWPAAFLYGLSLSILGVYAILWQQILKKLPLTVAYPNKAVTILFGMLWGAVLFGEKITWVMLAGAAVIAFGIVLLVTRDE